jgi:hypothetical protein
MNFSEYFIDNIKLEIENLETELNYIHNQDSLSPLNKIKKLNKILSKISKRKNILSLYLSYILESKQKQHDNVHNQ